MRWTIGGHRLPPELLQAQEEGRLVFFCGAGVSCRAGLPGFYGLVNTGQGHKPQHARRYPAQVLVLLNRVVGSDSHWLDPEIGAILSTIQSVRPELKETPAFRRLDKIFPMRGGP